MNAIKESVLTLCIVLIAVEVLSRFIPKNDMTNFVRALISLLLIVSAVATVWGQELNFDFATGEGNIGDTQLNTYIGDKYEQAAQADTQAYIEGLLETIQIKSEKIQVFTDINADSSILIEKISIDVQYEVDKERAEALLKNVIGDEIEVEVKISGK